LFIVHTVLLFAAFLLTFVTFRRTIPITDVSLFDGRNFVRTAFQHRLHSMCCKKTFPVNFVDTTHPLLDRPENQFYARVNNSTELELLDWDRCSVNSRLDTSKGALRLSFPHEFLHTGLFLPVAVWVPLILGSAVSVAVVRLSGNHCLLGAAISLVLALFLALCVKSLSTRTPLDRRLREFQRKLDKDGWKPTPCPKGPDRAIAVGKLVETHEFFRSFVRDRNAYYMDGNIFKPLAKRSELSFAEVVGSLPVQYFCSHYWGTSFSHFCDSLRQHAMSKVRQGGSRVFSRTMTNVTGSGEWKETAYWVCFCSINQFRIKEELGESWRESSFFITLQSGLCRGTCMVLDPAAMPLTRSWCIFELFQTLKLEGQDNFDGLELSTASGLLNEGQSSVEVAINLVKRMATLDLEAAEASCQQDKEMINSLVVEEMGSFDSMNAFLQREIGRVLTQAQSKFSNQFMSLHALLDIDTAESRNKMLRRTFDQWKQAGRSGVHGPQLWKSRAALPMVVANSV
jgi:hypothetical protein